MISSGQLVGLVLACTLIIVVPGPSVLFIIGRALSYGRRTALFSILGNSIGSYLAAVCVSVGLGPLLQRSDVLFQTIKLLGAAYLVWLGVQAWRHSGDDMVTTSAGSPVQPPWRSLRTGVVVGVTNPKAFILFGAVLPQFVNRPAGSVPLQMLVLAVFPIAIGLVTDTGWGLLAGQAREWLSRTPRRMTVLGRVGGVSMIGLGLSVAVTGRHD
ncbi:MAG TPA: LysE family translocator [Pseudonocardiaceae bacterium]|nr:LysE family translocator [Pseudonocardiaceae bacterium]